MRNERKDKKETAREINESFIHRYSDCNDEMTCNLTPISISLVHRTEYIEKFSLQSTNFSDDVAAIG